MIISSSQNKLAAQLLKKIKNKKAQVAVVGVGYVGEQLARHIAGSGFSTTGIDINTQKIKRLQNENIPNLKLTDNNLELAKADIICICVPTPTDSELKPDLSFLKNAANDVADYLKKGQLIIIESTVAPLTTREIILPIIQNGKKGGIDFFLAYSPERVDPGNPKFDIANTPKIVSGLESDSLKLVLEFYKKFVKTVIPVSSIEIAEMSKMLENTFRLINISLINELSDYTNSIGVNIYEVIAAAGTKPYGFLAHYPGPGVGGHCIPVDPVYLLDHAKSLGINLKLIEDSILINKERAEKIFSKALELLNGKGESKKAKILIIGVAYKPGIADIRESPALKIIELAQNAGLEVSYHDPYVPQVNGLSSVELSQEILSGFDVIIITTNHNNIAYDQLLSAQKPIIDTRNVFVYTSQPQIVKI